MKNIHFYNEKTGLLHGNSIAVNAPEAEEKIMITRNCPEGYKPIEGNLHPLVHRVDIATGEIVEYQPPAPSADHEWNVATKRYQLNAKSQTKIDKRNAALAQIAQLELRISRLLLVVAVGEQTRRMAADRELREIDSQIRELEKVL